MGKRTNMDFKKKKKKNQKKKVLDCVSIEKIETKNKNGKSKGKVNRGSDRER